MRARPASEAELWEPDRGARWPRVLALAVVFFFGLVDRDIALPDDL